MLEGGGGLGAWPIGLSGAITIYIAVLAYQKKLDISVTKTDWYFFISALASIPVWIFSADPLWAVIILTTVDLLGFGPTVRKAYFHPFDENMTVFFIFTCRNLAAIIALETYSLTTVIFPAAIALACAILALMIIYRRRILSESA